VNADVRMETGTLLAWVAAQKDLFLIKTQMKKQFVQKLAAIAGQAANV
jgi:hypothetical protein